MPYLIRPATREDLDGLRLLYQEVAAIPDCLARRPHEISREFIDSLFLQTRASGLMLVLEDIDRRIVGAIHATYGELEGLRHVMGQLTILIHPARQCQGLGKKLFGKFLEVVECEMPHIRRVELRAIASNTRALTLYESLGFISEGRFQGRILSQNGQLADGIPMVWINPRWRDPFALSLDADCI